MGWGACARKRTPVVSPYSTNTTLLVGWREGSCKPLQLRRFCSKRIGSTDLNGKPGTLSSLLGVIDGFRKDYKYDTLFRPWTMITTIPSAPPGAGTWTARQFNVEYGYDRNYGRVKAVGFPSTTQGAIGEIARFDY